MSKTQEKQVIPSTVALHLLTDAHPIIPEQWLVAPRKRELEGTCESPSVILGLPARQLCILKEAFLCASGAKLLLWCLVVNTKEFVVCDLFPGLILCVPLFW